jgi:hypothetical protein
MRTILFTLAIVLGLGEARAGDKPDPDRVKGLKAAVTDVETGVLRLILPPAPAPLSQLEYAKLLRTEYGVEATTAGFGPAEGGEKADGGYNDVMRAEIEHRFGAGVLDRLQKRAEDIADGRGAGVAMKVLKEWRPMSNDAKDNDAWRKAPEGGVVAGPKEWAALWKAWYGDEDVPEVDFDKEILLVVAGAGPNIVRVGDLVLSDKGDLKFACTITERGGDGFVGIILKVSREGVKTVNGKEMPKE